MPLSVIATFLTFTVITAFTPGPNNILALSSGSRYGFKGCMPVVAGICLGFLCVMAACGAMSLYVSEVSGNVIIVMKYVGCLYIVWLAWSVATSDNGKQSAEQKSSGFIEGLILQFVNVKIIIYGLTAFTAFVLPYYGSVTEILCATLVLTFIGSAGVVTWALAGSVLQTFLVRHAKVANTVMGLMLLGCAVNLVR